MNRERADLLECVQKFLNKLEQIKSALVISQEITKRIKTWLWTNVHVYTYCKLYKNMHVVWNFDVHMRSHKNKGSIVYNRTQKEKKGNSRITLVWTSNLECVVCMEARLTMVMTLPCCYTSEMYGWHGD